MSSFLVLSFCLSLLTISGNNKPIFSIKSTDPIVIMTIDQSAPTDGVKVGSITSKAISTNCSYHEVIGLLKKKAKRNGANIIKIIEHKPPSSSNSCHRIKADLYKVKNPRKYEKEIYWSQDRKLTWDDFKAASPSVSFKDVAALTVCRINFQSNSVTLSSPVKIWITNVFDCNKSWVGENQKTPAILNHEQVHFDLSEVYVRKMRKAVQEAHITGATLKTVGKSIFEMYHQGYAKQQDLYDSETKYGLSKQKQIEWNIKIRKQLENLNEFQF